MRLLVKSPSGTELVYFTTYLSVPLGSTTFLRRVIQLRRTSFGRKRPSRDRGYV